ncbi:hypothetical protein FB554_0464 [Barrientosiimonas humi]|uniref:Uncharacterized protein n=1 Tax=Barrientosiimonas humi TaxID=999931 RepID=A0A542X955_9MICO|nr:hypothetical protein FB554_0464 [Barrientosiimonas humi]CAG7572331.1 hypothetical protein BH39T_PBIAJDOK_00945 [Barrientosiimonas humi]
MGVVKQRLGVARPKRPLPHSLNRVQHACSFHRILLPDGELADPRTQQDVVPALAPGMATASYPSC